MHCYALNSTPQLWRGKLVWVCLSVLPFFRFGFFVKKESLTLAPPHPPPLSNRMHVGQRLFRFWKRHQALPECWKCPADFRSIAVAQSCLLNKKLNKKRTMRLCSTVSMEERNTNFSTCIYLCIYPSLHPLIRQYIFPSIYIHPFIPLSIHPYSTNTNSLLA